MFAKYTIFIALLIGSLSAFELGPIEVRNKKSHYFAGDSTHFNTSLSEHTDGEAILPIVSSTYLLPPGADLGKISVVLKNLKIEEIAASTKVRHYWEKDPQPEKNLTPVTTMGKIPYLYSVDTRRLYRYKLVTVSIYPYSFNPESGKLSYLSSASMLIRFPEVAPEISRSTSEALELHRKNMAMKNCLNFNQFESLYHKDTGLRKQSAAAASKITYVIATGSNVQGSSARLADFIASKERRGFNVMTISPADWGGGTGAAASANIISWLTANVNTESIGYLLLIGSHDSTSGEIPLPEDKDYAYETIEGGPIAVGRIPWYGKGGDLDKILQRIIDYENCPPSAADWRKKILLHHPTYDYGNWQAFEQFKTEVVPFENWPLNVNEGADANRAEFISDWNSDRFGLVAWFDHSSSFHTTAIETDEVPSLDTSFAPHMVQISCETAKIYFERNLAYTLLKHVSISNVAAEEEVYGAYNRLGVEYSNNLINHQMRSGDAMISVFHNWRSSTTFVLYGDPAVGLFTTSNEYSPILGFATAPVTDAAEDTYFQYDITVSDSNGVAGGTISAVLIPDWLTLQDNGNGSATLSGTPGQSNVTMQTVVPPVPFGENDVVLKASGIGIEVRQVFTINVAEVLDKPEFGMNKGDTTVLTGSLFTKAFPDVDEDFDEKLKCEILNPPPFLSMFSAVGDTLYLTAKSDSVLTYDFILRVEDKDGLSDTINYTVDIVNSITSPNLSTHKVSPSLTFSRGILNLNSAGEGGIMFIYNYLGKQCYRQNVSTGGSEQKFNLNEILPPGLYHSTFVYGSSYRKLKIMLLD